MTAEAFAEGHGALEIDGVAGAQAPEVRAGVCLVGDVGLPPVGAGLDKGEAAAVHGDGGPESGTLQDSGGTDAQAATVTGLNPAQFLHNPREHGVETNPGGVGSHWWFS